MKKYTIHWFLCRSDWRCNELCCYSECRYKEGSLYCEQLYAMLPGEVTVFKLNMKVYAELKWSEGPDVSEEQVYKLLLAADRKGTCKWL